MPTLDELSPEYLRAKVIKLTPATLEAPRAFNAIELNVSLELGGEIGELVKRVGLAGHIEMTVTSPSSSGFTRHIFRRGLPSQISFTPREGGPHMVTVKEVAHNYWWGSISINVAGEQLNPRT